MRIPVLLSSLFTEAKGKAGRGPVPGAMQRCTTARKTRASLEPVASGLCGRRLKIQKSRQAGRHVPILWLLSAPKYRGTGGAASPSEHPRPRARDPASPCLALAAFFFRDAESAAACWVAGRRWMLSTPVPSSETTTSIFFFKIKKKTTTSICFFFLNNEHLLDLSFRAKGTQ